METIISKERFLPCPICEHPVSSNLPECERCGLEVSAGGIDELARLEEAKKEAVQDALLLKGTAKYFLLFSIFFSILFSKEAGWLSFYLIGFWVFGFINFGWKLYRWHQNHSQAYSEFDELTEAVKEKNKAVAVFLISLSVSVFFVWTKL